MIDAGCRVSWLQNIKKDSKIEEDEEEEEEDEEEEEEEGIILIKCYSLTRIKLTALYN